MAPRADSPDTSSAEDIPPLPYDSEQEVLDVLARLKRDLERRVEQHCKAKGKGKQKASFIQNKDQVMDIVLKQFFDKIQPAVLSNCTIAGMPYAQYKQLQETGEDSIETQPFSEELHKRVLINQNQLFDDREANIQKRVEEPAMAANAVRELIDADMGRLDALAAARVEFVDSKPPQPKGRKSVGVGKAEPGPTAQQAQQDFETSKATIDKLLKDVPKLATAAEEATKVARDAAMVE
ncbi:hypothetical protein OIO90_006254 [Microbotryomycetes sp. JL221]|nr:hypothetical protein OIO90_006254 [Microbotryomycetes sp. JL221]